MICKKCGIDKPIELFSWHKPDINHDKIYYDKTCKLCRNEMQIIKYQQDKIRKNLYIPDINELKKYIDEINSERRYISPIDKFKIASFYLDFYYTYKEKWLDAQPVNTQIDFMWMKLLDKINEYNVL